MILIGESINVMRKDISQAIKERDKKPIQDLALHQVEAGADYLDLNIGPSRKEGPEIMEWMVNIVQDVVDVPLSLDTTNYLAIEAGLKVVKKRPIINSVSSQKERLKNTLPLAKKYNVPFVALLLSDEGIPRDVSERANVLFEILSSSQALGIPNEDVWVDPIVLPVSADQKQMVEFVEFLKVIPDLVGEELKTICGLSNVSNGSPKELRSILNCTYLTMLQEAGLYSAIVDVLDENILNTAKGKILDSFSSLDVEKTRSVLKNEVLYCHSWLEL
ncbi:MAG: dihydropteroate synthase [bacterium]|nr:dihydropteroate synthase [bacterium]